MPNHQASGTVDPNDPLYAPGLRRRTRADGSTACYWIAPHRQVNKGWKRQSVALGKDLTESEIAAKCQELWAELDAWRKGQPVKTRYSIDWLIAQYQTDPHSPYRQLKQKTQHGYDQCMRIIEATYGKELIDAHLENGIMRPRIFGRDIRKWHHTWGQPDRDGRPTTPVRAWHCMGVLRILFSYAIELGVPGAKDLRDLVGSVRISVPEARDAAPERNMVLAHVKRAADKGFVSMAIATLAQFEFTERRTHIIGTWERAGDSRQWRPGWIWTGITPDWVITYHQTKIGKVERQFDLKDTPALLELLQRIPQEQRIGAVIVCETTGQPWRERHYANVWRSIAREIGMPDDIWSMDMRAGGATEAGKIQGITSVDLQAAGGWKDPKMAARYTRDRKTRAQNVVQLRQAAAKRTGGE